MSFDELLRQVRELLQSKGRVSYRALKLQFHIDDEYIAGLKDELIEAERAAHDEDGKVLVWAGKRLNGETGKRGSSEREVVSAQLSVASPQPPTPNTQHSSSGLRTPNSELGISPAPITYTPLHLAERIRAVTVTDGERKVITALFADLKGSTALIEGLDPEEARAIIDPALQLMMDAVHRYEGYVAQALGDGIFALFGAPIAHEDHPQRALYAALRMQEEMRRYSDTLRIKGYPPFAMRVGINTGEVVVRSIRKDDLHTDYVPVGHSTNLAARMEQLAAPGSILVTEQTHKLTAGYCEFKALGKTQIKGVEEPLNVYEVLGAGPLRTRLQVAVRRGLTRFVGRQSEIEQMRRALEQAQVGHGQIVGVMGEPGVGKSRLFYEFKLTSQQGCLLLEAFSVSYGKASAYLPVIELLKDYFQIQPQDDERSRREKVIGKVLGLDRSLEDTLPYLFVLLGIEDPASSLQQMDPQIRRRRTFEALKRLFLRESLNQPLILIFEDLHWIDTETQGFLNTLKESVASARILLLVNYRPEYRHEWGAKTYYSQLHLAALGKAEAEALLTFLLGNAPSLTALKHLILEKTDGTPFFMEEVVQTLAEEGALVGERGNYQLEKTPPALHISPTVQGVLAARIDRLTLEEKELLQQLAIIGREFPLSLLTQVTSYPEEALYRLLASLQSKEFLYEQPAFPEVEYMFKHALTQEVAYGTVLQERRKALHEQTAQVIERLYRDRLEEHYSELAYHYRRSHNVQKAIDYLQLAGQQAVQRSANTEAINHFAAALELLEILPDTPERAQQELTVQLAVGVPLKATQGSAAPEVGHVYTRARDLCQQIGDPLQHFAVLVGLANFHHMRADLEMAKAILTQSFTLAEQTQNPLFLARAHNGLGATLSFLGDQAAAWNQLEQGLTLGDSQPFHSPDLVLVFDPTLDIRAHAARLLWLLGFPDHALRRGAEAVALARKQDQAANLCIPLTFAAWCRLFRGEAEKAQELADTLIMVATEHGFVFHSGMGLMMRGRALVQQGQLEEGLAQFRQGWTEQQATGSQLNRPYHLAFLAETYGKMGQTTEGLALVSEALAVIQTTQEAWWEAELYRLKGELTLQQRFKVQGSTLKVENSHSAFPNPQSEAETCFLKAIEIAQKQQAKSLELRAVMSLSRLWQRQGKPKEAHKLLSEIYGWFTEGFDTKDLQEAKALLNELAEGV